MKVRPKSLLSFDHRDADFFLELLPGPRDGNGLPASILYWKSRIEEKEPEQSFRVGVMYGPSGCGKSSLVKAGLLPRLAKQVRFVYVEATPNQTEARLIGELRKRCSDLPNNLDLSETLSTLRTSLSVGEKVLVVLDQFEQWLAAKGSEENPELITALRHCDGERLQAIVMVRDDFWMALVRFMARLEIELQQSRNFAAVDLFDIRHAKKVLKAFGQASGALPEQEKGATKDQDAFLDQAVAGLAQDGKVISVRLALFFQMVKGRTWTPATLKEVGGPEGVGVTFLEEAFSAATAPPQHRKHQKEAQAVLKSLLPESGTDIKGHMRSYSDLQAASGYANRTADFNDLIRILDSEIRLITPADPEGKEGAEDSPSQAQPGQKYYQLTHDYLVHSLRDWLTRKQRETQRGRAELRLTVCSSVWNAKPENRYLPAWWEWLSIRLLTRKRDWTGPQRKMMRKAIWHHAVRGLGIAVVLALIGWGVYEVQGRSEVHALMGRLLDANTTDVPTIVQDMAPYRRWIDPLLHDAYAQAKASKEARKQLHASIALMPVDATQVDYLYGRLLDAEPHEVPVILDALAAHQSELANKLWAVVEKPEKGKESQRLRGAAALAKYYPEGEKWAKVQDRVANDLLGVPTAHLPSWMESFRPVRQKLQAPLAVVYRDGKSRETERSRAADILADYVGDEPHILADLLMDADEKQFSVLYPKFQAHDEHGLAVLRGELNRKLSPDAQNDVKEKLAKRQANAAVALLRMNHPESMWSLLKYSDDPRVRSYLIHRLGPLGAEAGTVVKRLHEEPDVTIRRALILSLGQFAEQSGTVDGQGLFIEKMQELYQKTDDAGLHAAAEWLLRHWEQETWLRKTQEAWAKDKEAINNRMTWIKQSLAQERGKAKAHWYVNSQGQTMVVIPGPVEFVMGTTATKEQLLDAPPRQRKRIGRTFAIGATPVTVDEYRRFNKDHYMGRQPPQGNCPAVNMTWFQAAGYCNWLSGKENLDKCYEEDERGVVTRLNKGYLSLSGYRLPTEAEWECACRAGTITSRYFGEADDLLTHYGWSQSDLSRTSRPVGMKKPNDIGLFDMLGNVWCWCQEKKSNANHQDEKRIDDNESELVIGMKDRFLMRGSSFANHPADVNCTCQFWQSPSAFAANFGFRIARSFR